MYVCVSSLHEMFTQKCSSSAQVVYSSTEYLYVYLYIKYSVHCVSVCPIWNDAIKY